MQNTTRDDFFLRIASEVKIPFLKPFLFPFISFLRVSRFFACDSFLGSVQFLPVQLCVQ